jgi:hypothetical protein
MLFIDFSIRLSNEIDFIFLFESVFVAQSFHSMAYYYSVDMNIVSDINNDTFREISK